MPRVPILNLRVSYATKARWVAAAQSEGVTLSDFIRAAVEERIGSERSVDAGEREGRQPRPDPPFDPARPAEPTILGDDLAAFKGPRFK